MKFDKNLAAVHGYLCADGYVTKNNPNQKHKYYRIGLRNTNNTLLLDFQNKFYKRFGIRPKMKHKERCLLHSKELFETLTKDFSYYSREWKVPRLPKFLLKFWLRAFFDCEAWVECQKSKSRSIRVDSINSSSLNDVSAALKKFNIESSTKNRNNDMSRLSICGLDDIKKFQRQVGFLHPNKKLQLKTAISSYRIYKWKIPKQKNKLLGLIKEKGKTRNSRNEIRMFSIKKSNLIATQKALLTYKIKSKLQGPWKNNNKSTYYCLILKLDETRKLGGKT